MINTLEKRLNNLENDVKELKATYNVAGGNVRLYVTKASYTATLNTTTTVKATFTPTYIVGPATMATMNGKAVKTGGTKLFTFWGAHQVPQDGTGKVVLEYPIIDSIGMPGDATYSFEAVVSSTSPGTIAFS